MSNKFLNVLVVAGIALLSRGAIAGEESVKFHPKIAAYIDARVTEFDQIPNQRKAQLEELARYVKTCRSAGQPAKLTFICTHNSRRSHMSQLWAAAAAAHFGIDAVETYSGGTESTAFNPRAVAALERAGFEITKGDEVANQGDAKTKTGLEPPNKRYRVVFATNRQPLVCFSKVYDSDPNPTADFCAVMTCLQADKNCLVVPGASHRVAIAYDDPKAADGTPQEAETYDQRCAQIAREMLFAFSRVK